MKKNTLIKYGFPFLTSFFFLGLFFIISSCGGGGSSSGTTPIMVEETYSAPLFGTFTLSRANIDLTTIEIKVMSDTGALIDLARNVNYIIEPASNMVQITIVSLPPVIVAGHSAQYSYTFWAYYGLL